MLSLTRVLALSSLLCVFFVITLAQDVLAQSPALDFSALKKQKTVSIVGVIDPYRLSTSDGRIIRLSGINIPDYHPDRPGEVSLMAVRVLDDMLRGKDVTLYQSKNKLAQTNRMGHLAAHVVSDNNVWVQGALLQLGLARVETDSETPEMARDMIARERAARTSKAGLWAFDSYGVLSPADAPKYFESFQIIEGTIHAAAMKNNRTYLNFGENWKNDFTVSIAPKDKRKFIKAGIDPLNLGKVKVRVRGWLSDYNGPYIEITHPEALEILSTAPAPQTAP